VGFVFVDTITSLIEESCRKFEDNTAFSQKRDGRWQGISSPFVAEVLVYAHKNGPVAEEIRAVVRPDQEALDEHAAKQGRAPLSGAEVESLIRGEISGACEKLAPYKRVKCITIRYEEFPKTTTRKIKRFELEALVSSVPCG
jgi:long-chain acyl-CoA synthetase